MSRGIYAFNKKKPILHYNIWYDGDKYRFIKSELNVSNNARSDWSGTKRNAVTVSETPSWVEKTRPSSGRKVLLFFIKSECPKLHIIYASINKMKILMLTPTESMWIQISPKSQTPCYKSHDPGSFIPLCHCSAAVWPRPLDWGWGRDAHRPETILNHRLEQNMCRRVKKNKYMNEEMSELTTRMKMKNFDLNFCKEFWFCVIKILLASKTSAKKIDLLRALSVININYTLSFELMSRYWLNHQSSNMISFIFLALFFCSR